MEGGVKIATKVAKLLVRNRPLGHYVLSVYSLLFRGYCVDDTNKNDIITLIAPSRSIGRTTDLANILARVCAPGLLWLSGKRVKISNRFQRTKNSKGIPYPKVSNLIVNLTSFDRPLPSPEDIKEGNDFDQKEETEKALEEFNKKKFSDEATKYLKMEVYKLIEALEAYKKEHPDASRELKKLQEEFNKNLHDIQDEFFERIKAKTLQKFNICELEFILSTLLKKGCELHFSCPDGMNIQLKLLDSEKKNFAEGTPKITDKKIIGKMIDLGKVFLGGVNIKYKPMSTPSMPVTVKTCHYVKSSIEEALMRMGLLQSPKLEELAKDMCKFDDIIIGLDTNCFYHGVTTAGLLDSFVGVARYPYLDTPSWITLVASVISTGEIEHKANESKVNFDEFDSKDTQSTHNRRIAYRALQEFMEISICADLEGVSMFLTGEILPDINFSGENTVRDELIRKQIKNFLGKLGFHHGIYFLTEDRACAMFARAEGLNAVHLTRQKLDTTNDNINDISLTNLSPNNYGEEKDIHNVSELVYELGVEFPLKITCEGRNCSLSNLSIIVRTDWQGKSLEEWENRNFMVKFTPDNDAMAELFYTWLTDNAKAVKLGQLLWGWQQVNARHHEEPGFPSWAT